jgi:acyl carrier protein
VNTAEFYGLLAKAAKTESITSEAILFGSGHDLSSIAFLEFILELEERAGLDIDVDELDASIITAGQLYARIFPSA